MAYSLNCTIKTNASSKAKTWSTEKFDNLLDAIVRMKFLQNKTYQNRLNKKPHNSDSIMEYDLSNVLGCAVSDLDTGETDEFEISFLDYYNNRYRIELDSDDYIKEQLSWF